MTLVCKKWVLFQSKSRAKRSVSIGWVLKTIFILLLFFFSLDRGEKQKVVQCKNE